MTYLHYKPNWYSGHRKTILYQLGLKGLLNTFIVFKAKHGSKIVLEPKIPPRTTSFVYNTQLVQETKKDNTVPIGFKGNVTVFKASQWFQKSITTYNTTINDLIWMKNPIGTETKERQYCTNWV